MHPPIYDWLKADSSVYALVGDRIYPHGQAPAKVISPYVTWFVAGGTPEHALDGPPPIEHYLVNVRVWADNGADVFTIGEQVRDALEPLGALEEVPTSGQDEETRRYYVSMPFRFWVDRPPLASSI